MVSFLSPQSSSDTTVIDPRWELDVEIARLMAATPTVPVLTSENLAERRAQVVAHATLATRSDRVTRSDIHVPGPPGAPDVLVRVYEPPSSPSPRSAIIAIHGGGLVMGSYVQDDERLSRWSYELGLVAISVDYRLAPEHPYPKALEDCYTVLTWVFAHAGAWRLDPNRIGVFGASAGGGLAASLTLFAREQSEVQPAVQLLVFPMLDDRQQTPSSNRPVPVWPREANEFGWRCYLGEMANGSEVPFTAAPSRAEDLADLPPAFICVGTADLFCDEDIAYAQRLIQHGVPTELHVYAGAPHGFISLFSTSSLARRCETEMDAWLRTRLEAASE